MNEKNEAMVVVDGWKLERFEHEKEPRVRDVDLGERLGFTRPRKVRDLIREHTAKLEKLGALVMRPVTVRIEKTGAIRGVEERTVDEYWLNRNQALYVVMHSGTATAGDVSVALIRAYDKLTQEVAALRSKVLEYIGGPGKLLPFVAAAPIERDGVWDWEIAENIASLYGQQKPDRSKGYPAFMAGFIGWIYDCFPQDIIQAVRERSKAAHTKRYQFMTDLLLDDLRTLQTMLRMALSSPSARTVADVKAHIEYGIAVETARRLGIPRSASTGLQCELLPCGMCPSCGQVNMARAHFCQHCGSRLAA